MTLSGPRLLLAFLLCSAPALSACASAPAAPAGTGSARGVHTRADVSFMRGMIGHHAQALLMTQLVPARSTRPELRALSQRIDVSQRAEIARMRTWLARRGESVPSEDATTHAAAGHGALMPGMLTAAELTALEHATGAAFERLFLELMIRHHEGAIRMVEELRATPGAAEEPELFLFASDISADQSAEIRRMRSLLATLPR